jgi:hypothetical protein
MKLYLVRRTDDVGYDEYDSIVVAANDETEARNTHPYGSDYKWTGKVWTRHNPVYGRTDDATWADPETLTVEPIGTANEGVAGVICSSFNAG